ncbi:MAG: DUF4184 family protein [Candidatus Diapherotrites archaeon]|nr:DUF4184 family protein [Candidatus Diapherotrites archaeon]
MPFTLFHWAVAILALFAFNFFYLPALLVSSVIMDIEPSYYLFFSPREDNVLHDFFHTYLGVTIIGFIVGAVLIRIRKPIDKFFSKFNLGQEKIPNKLILFSSLVGAWSHVFFDSLMHWDIKPFFPFTNANPLLGLISYNDVYIVTASGLYLFLALAVWKFAKKIAKRK